MPHPAPFVFAPGTAIRLADVPTRPPRGSGGEAAARARLPALGRDLRRHHTYLMAHEAYGLLVLFQGMDASGKDEAIEHVLSAADPRGSEFKQFQPLTEKELRHDYLWRASFALPARGQLGIFNRSYYEHVVAERVHPEHLDAQGLPPEARADVWEKRFRQLNDYERYLTENGVHVLKFYLHVSPEVQRARLLERIDRHEQRWQFSSSDVAERARWPAYMAAYDAALTATNTDGAPWHVVPADRPWAARAAVGAVVVEKLRALHTDFPAVSEAERAELAAARRALLAEAGPAWPPPRPGR